MNMAFGQKMSLLAAAVAGLCAATGAQAATLSCGTPLHITTKKATWSTDARYYVAPPATGPGAPAAIVNDYRWRGWFAPTANHAAGTGPLEGTAIAAEWLSFGDAQYSASTNDGTTGSGPYPAVQTNGDTSAAYGSKVAGRVSFTYNEPITIGSNVDLSTIRILGSVGTDDGTLFQVRPANTPAGATNWVQTQNVVYSYANPGLLDLNGNSVGLGFYYGDNTISFAVENAGLAPTTSADNPTGLLADFNITADCLQAPPPPPTTELICPVGNTAGQTVRIGPFTTNARDWKWKWRMNDAGSAIENVEQPLFDSYLYRDYFRPASLTGAQATQARWISPGTERPASTDIPGVPYPFAKGQAGFNAAAFTLNQPITVGNNVDLNTIRFDGRFGFDDNGDGVFVQPAGQATPTFVTGNYLPDGYGAFTALTTAPIPGFARGSNTIGLMANGGQANNSCSGGTCALAGIADFYVQATCTGEAPIPSGSVARPVPVLGAAGVGLLGLLSAGAGALALRRRKKSQ